MNEDLTDVLIVSYRENEINQDRIINLEKQVSEKQTEIKTVDKELDAKDEIISAQDTINRIAETQLELSNKEKRKRKTRDDLRKIGDFFKDTWEIFTAALGGVAIGAGVGYVAK